MKIRQISIFLENIKGRLAEVTGLLAREGVDIRALSLADTSDFGVLRIIVDDPERCLAVLKRGGLVARSTDVVAVEMEDKPGGLARVLEVLDGAGINVEYMYAYVARTKGNAIVICKIDDREKALSVLADRGIPTITAEALKTL